MMGSGRVTKETHKIVVQMWEAFIHPFSIPLIQFSVPAEQ